MNTKLTESSLSDLMQRAEASLALHLAESPESKHKCLKEFYSEIQAGAPRRAVYPTARGLFWDAPQNKVEEQCLDDALAVFQFLRKN